MSYSHPRGQQSYDHCNTCPMVERHCSPLLHGLWFNCVAPKVTDPSPPAVSTSTAPSASPSSTFTSVTSNSTRWRTHCVMAHPPSYATCPPAEAVSVFLTSAQVGELRHNFDPLLRIRLHRWLQHRLHQLRTPARLALQPLPPIHRLDPADCAHLAGAFVASHQQGQLRHLRSNGTLRSGKDKWQRRQQEYLTDSRQHFYMMIENSPATLPSVIDLFALAVRVLRLSHGSLPMVVSSAVSPARRAVVLPRQCEAFINNQR